MPWNPQLTALRNRLALLVPKENDARRIVEEAQLPTAYIDFDNKAINNWHNILNQAALRDKIEAIVHAAFAQAGNDAELMTAYQAYMTAIGRPASLPPTQPPPAMATAMPPQPMPQTRPIKILFLAANPRDMARLKLDEEVRAIDQALRLAAFRDRFDLIPHWAVRYRDLQELLLRHQPDIVHFSGHGTQDEQILLMSDSGDSHPVSSRALSTLLPSSRTTSDVFCSMPVTRSRKPKRLRSRLTW